MNFIKAPHRAKGFARFLSQLAVISFSAFTLYIFAGCASAFKMPERTTVSTSSIGGGVVAQSHFTYPNSNVIPIGKVKGSARASGTLQSFPNIGDTINRAMKQAIGSKSGADLLLNIIQSGTITTYSTTGMRNDEFFYDVRYELEVVVEGTAAKMEVGRQNLR